MSRMTITTPRLIKPRRGGIEVKLPYASNRRAWLRSVMGEGAQPEWHAVEGATGGGDWSLPSRYTEDVIRAVADAYAVVEVWAEYADDGRHTDHLLSGSTPDGHYMPCSAACEEASDSECECVCGGNNHATLGSWDGTGGRVPQPLIYAIGNKSDALTWATADGTLIKRYTITAGDVDLYDLAGEVR